MTFERNQNWFGGDANQTLEPEFQYLYVPYKDQDNIGVYDSTGMRQDYYSLFSDRRYAGLDRISDSNRVSIGLTSRVYDEAGDERIRLAVAQAFDFVAPRVKLYPSETLTTNTRSPLSFEGMPRSTSSGLPMPARNMMWTRAGSAPPTAPSSIAARS